MREKIDYGFKTWNGTVLTDGDVDAYNSLVNKVNRYTEDGIAVPDDILNAMHNIMNRKY